MSDAFIGEIRLLPYNFAPQGWASCNGQLIPVSQNQALYFVIGNRYGGDQNNMALPNLQGRTAMGTGSGPGLTPRSVAQNGGEQTVTLNANNMPGHTHGAQGNQIPGTSGSPEGRLIFGGENDRQFLLYKASANPAGLQPMSPQSLQPVGGNQPHNNLQPFLALQFCIALEGTFPQQP